MTVGRYRHEAGGLERGAPPRRCPRTPSPPRSRRNSLGESWRGADDEGSQSSYDRGVRDGMRRQRELDAATDDDGVIHLCILELCPPWLCLRDDSVQDQ